MKLSSKTADVYEITLQITRYEAGALIGVCNSVGGCPTTSGRRVTDDLTRALNEAFGGDSLEEVDCSGSITFCYDADAQEAR